MANPKSIKSLFESQEEESEILLKINLDEIKSKEQVRKVFKNLEGLGRALRKQQDHPIIVAPRGDDGKYIIQKGERRYRAAKLEGLESIQAIVRPWPADKKNKIIGELSENIQREDLQPLEIANALIQLKDEGLNQEQMAIELGKSKSWINGFILLIKLPDEIKDLVNEDIVRDKDTLLTLAKIHKADRELSNHLIKIAKEDGITRKQALEYYKSLKTSVDDNSNSQSEADKDNDLNNDKNTIATREEDHQDVNNDLNSDNKKPEGTPLDTSPANDLNIDKKEVNIQDQTSQVSESKHLNEEQISLDIPNEREGDLLKLIVSFNDEEGVLILDKTPSNSGLVWVNTDGGNKEVAVSSIKILKVDNG